MYKISRNALLIIFFTGCTSIPQKVDLDSSVKSRLHKIALLKITPSQGVSIRNRSNAGVILGFGVIPTAIEEKIIAEKTNNYLEKMHKRRITFVPELVAALQRELRKSGHDVVYLENQRPQLKEDKKTVDYSNITTDADAILNVFYGSIGYLSPVFKESYAPWVVIGVRLVDGRTRETLFFKNYNVTQAADRINNPNIDAIFPDTKFSYGSFEELMSKFDESIEGILNSQEKIAARIVQQLE
jgi:hypothetical protein